MNTKYCNPEYRCDCCARMLLGWDKGVYRSEDYICIKGKLTLQLNDEELGKRFFVHLIPVGREIVTVCDLKCLKQYMDVQHAQYMKSRDAHLRHIASNEIRP